MLRAWEPADIDVLAAAVARNLDHLRPWMPWVVDEPLPRPRRLELIKGWARDRADGGDAVYGAFEDGVVVGGCGLHRRQGPDCVEIGYWVDAAQTSRGVATTMAGLLSALALTTPGIAAVEIRHDKANVASGRIPARLGYTFVGETPDEVTAPGEVGIELVWRLSRPSLVSRAAPIAFRDRERDR